MAGLGGEAALREYVDSRVAELVRRAEVDHDQLRRALDAHESAGQQEISRLNDAIILRTDYLAERLRILTGLMQLQLDQRYAAVAERITVLAENWQQIADLLRDEARDASAAALAAQEKAIAKSEAATHAQFESANERFQQMAAFATQLSGQHGTYMLRAEVDTSIKALADKTDSQVAVLTRRIQEEVARSDASRNALELRLTSRLDLAEGRLSGAGEQRSDTRLNINTVISAIALIVVAVSVIIAILHK